MPALTTILIWGVVALVVIGVGYFIFVLVAASIGWKRHYDGYDPRAARDTDWTDPIVVNLRLEVGEDEGEYTGEVVDEKPHGRGLWFGNVSYSDGSQPLEEIEDYAQVWKEELLKGRTEFTFEKGKYGGDIYVGEFKYGKFDGQGTFTHVEDSDPHEWKGVKYEGFHYEEVYVGGFKDGKRSGQGAWDYGDGWTYVGEFRNDLWHGQGSFTFDETSGHDKATPCWRGESTTVVVDTVEVQGKTVNVVEDPKDQGMDYVGEFKDGKREGQGTGTNLDYTVANSAAWKYVGEWVDNREHGQGVMDFEDGAQFVGEFMDGEPWTGAKTDYDKEGNVTKTITYSNGEIVDS